MWKGIVIRDVVEMEGENNALLGECGCVDGWMGGRWVEIAVLVCNRIDSLVYGRWVSRWL